MSFLKGENRILYIKISGSWVPIGCLESNAFSETSEMLPTTTRENNGWETSVPISQSYTISFTGVQVKTVDNTKVSYDSLKGYKRNKTLLEWKVEDSVNSLVDFGSGYIISIGESAEASGVLTFDGEIQGYGLPITYIDGTIPSTPFLSLQGVTSTSVTIEWTASTDDVGVTGYNIYRDNVLYATVTGLTLEYTDYGVVDGTTYGYNVSAVDAQGNESGKSNKITSGTISKPGADYFLFQDSSLFQFQDGASFEFQ